MRSLVVLALLVSSTACAEAQRRSQRQEIMQMVGDTKIQAMYIRPVARGRDLFGVLVPFGRVWTPSADSAMRVTFSTDVTVGGQSLKAGSYSVWTIPDSAQWTIVFNTKPNAFHLTHSAGDDLLKVSAKVDSLSYVENLTLSFPSVDGKKAVMQIQWGATAVTLPIEVP
jgi:hypothetical protein